MEFIFILNYTRFYKLEEGKSIINKLIKYSNNRRYYLETKEFDLLKLTEELDSLLAIEAPFNILSGLDHFTLAKKYANSSGSRKGFKVYIYENGKEIKGSPFNSYRSGGKAIGLNSVSSISNYIDTGKLFKGRYIFFSRKLD